MSSTKAAAIQARADAATEGPWHERHDDDEYFCARQGDFGWVTPGPGPEYDADTDQCRADAEFIAYARTDVPALIAAVETAQQAAADFHATLAADGFIAITQAEHAELERLRAGGEWQWGVRYDYPKANGTEWYTEDHAEFGDFNDGHEWARSTAARHAPNAAIVRRRVGPVETVQDPT